MSIKFAPTSFSPYFCPNSTAFQCLLLSKVSLLRSRASSGIARGFVDGSWNKRKARSRSIHSGHKSPGEKRDALYLCTPDAGRGPGGLYGVIDGCVFKAAELAMVADVSAGDFNAVI